MYHKRGTLTHLTRHRHAVIQRGNYPHPIWRPASITRVGPHPTGHRYYLLRFTTKNNIDWYVPGRSNRSGNTPIAVGFRQIRRTQKYVDFSESKNSAQPWNGSVVDEILVAGCIGRCQNDKIQYSRWWNDIDQFNVFIILCKIQPLKYWMFFSKARGVYIVTHTIQYVLHDYIISFYSDVI